MDLKQTRYLPNHLHTEPTPRHRHAPERAQGVFPTHYPPPLAHYKFCPSTNIVVAQLTKHLHLPECANSRQETAKYVGDLLESRMTTSQRITHRPARTHTYTHCQEHVCMKQSFAAHQTTPNDPYPIGCSSSTSAAGCAVVVAANSDKIGEDEGEEGRGEEDSSDGQPRSPAQEQCSN